MQAFNIAVATPTQLRPQQYTFAAIRGDDAVPAAARASASRSAATSDRVTLSDTARKLAKAVGAAQSPASSASEPVSQDAAEQAKEKIQDRLEKLQNELEAIEGGNLPREEKEERARAIRHEIMLATAEIARLLEVNGGNDGGGTVAEGMASSLT